MEVIFVTEEEQFQYDQEKNLWKQNAMKIGNYVPEVKTGENSPQNGFLFSPLGQFNSSVESIMNVQNETQKIPINIGCTFDELCQYSGIKQNEELEKDYKKYKDVIYIKDTEEIKQSEDKKGIKNFIDEIKKVEIKKEVQIDTKELKTEIKVNIEKNEKETEKWEEWLDDILS